MSFPLLSSLTINVMDRAFYTLISLRLGYKSNPKRVSANRYENRWRKWTHTVNSKMELKQNLHFTENQMDAMRDMNNFRNSYSTEVRADRPFLFLINLEANNLEPDVNDEPERFIMFIGAFYGPQTYI